MERSDVVVFKGNPLTLVGEEAKVGQKARDFKALASDMTEKMLDTPVCDTEIKRFNDEASGLTKDLVIIFISMDLPFAQKRFCDEFEINKIKALSDHREADFGNNYGVLIKDLRLLARAIFLLDKNNVIKYVEYVKDLGKPPDYDAALKAIKSVATGK